ncbi:PREDICTED: far upstream element-binding protein 1-like isoform X2 [Lupinus angustifolius]|uniref:far upstream element-binding protein 1-like isoform X2 n=1 Tax=Lupinus angustifolius TaxID=3871 RepID=UPI00092E8398|nr:PREDICTED: far upstream element-binding protein 1-like isoform X2 [Lupinus angustifolius]
MADEFQYSDTTPPSLKRKYDDQSTAAAATDSDLTAGIEIAKQKAQEVAARLFNSAPPPPTLDPSKRSKTDNGFDSIDVKAQYPIPTISPSAVSYGHQGAASKKIDIPNGRVGVIIGKGGETIKYLQLQSGAKIQITRDSDADPSSPTRMVEIMGAPDAIAIAEKLISEVLAEAEAGGSGVVTRRLTGQAGSDEYVSKIPNNKVGLVIGKGGETIKNMQASSGARIQVIPLHLPPGDTSTERTLKIEGTPEQIESAKQLVNQVISGENRFRNPAMSGGYPQQGYQAQPPTSWAPPGAPAQQHSYGYVQPGSYSGPSSQYNNPQQQYAGYPPQPAGGYSTGWDQSTAQPLQQSSQGAGYDYYSQQAPQQPQNPGGAVAPGDGSAYNYSQPPASGYSQLGQGYAQDSYGGYQAPPQSGYGQPPSYDQQQGYGSAPGYGNGNNSAQEGNAPNYGSQADSTQVPPVQPSATQQGYAQPNYGVPPISQASYGSQPQMPSGYGPPQSQKPGATPPVYGQSQSPKTVAAGYGQSGYPPSGYGGAYGPTSYGAASGGQPGYGQAPPSYGNGYGTGYAQPPAYSSDGNAGSHGSYDGAPAQTAQQGTVAKPSPPQS